MSDTLTSAQLREIAERRDGIPDAIYLCARREGMATMKKAFDAAYVDIPALLKHIEALTAELAEHKAALKPFAECVDGFWDSIPDDQGIMTVACNGINAEFTMGDLRRAAELTKDGSHD